MTDDDKALVERLFAMADEYDSGHHESWPTIDALEIAAHRIEALSAENEWLREAILQMKRMPNYIRKDDNRKEMLKIINAALGETK